MLTVPSRIELLRLLSDASTELDEVLTLLRACGVPSAASLPIGVVDRLLLAVHTAVIGTDLAVVVRCRPCGALNALPLGPDDVPPHEPREAWCGPGAGVREPTGADLSGLPADPAAATRELVQRCATGPAAPSDPVRDAAALGRAEQSLCGEVAVACTGCGAPVRRHVDVQHLVATAVSAAVADVDVEVHLIASRYKWDLATIESLPERRRVRLATLAAGVAG
jgi:hypothetical protein